MESLIPLGVRVVSRIIRTARTTDAFQKEGEYVGVLYFILQNLLLNFRDEAYDFVEHTITIILRLAF